MWAKWVLSFGVGAILVVALVIYVDHNNSDSPPSENFAVQAKANREAEAVVATDQAPHVVRIAHGASPRAGFVGTVRTAMDGYVSKGIIDGPLQRVRCRRTGASGGTVGFSCVATANDVNYDFVGVVDRSSHRLTYCKRDEPPVPSQNVAVSRRCTL
jgi:hypothetical protein